MQVQTQDVSTHYVSSLEYFNDQLMILDLLIEELVQQVKQVSFSSLSAPNRLTITDDEALALLRVKFTYLQLSEPYQKLMNRLELIVTQKLQKTSESNQAIITILQLYEAYQLDELDKRVLVVLLAPHINKKYLRLYGYIQDDMTKQFVTLELLVKLCARSFADIRLLYERYSKLEGNYDLLYKLGHKQQVMFYESSLLIRPIQPAEQLVQFILTGDQYTTFNTNTFTYFHLHYLQTHLESLLTEQQLTTRLIDFTEKIAPLQPIFQLIGANGSGKTLHTKHYAVERKKAFIEVSLSALEVDKPAFDEQMKEIILVARLTDSIVALTKLDEQEEYTKSKLSWLTNLLSGYDGTVFIHSSLENAFTLTTNRPVNTITIPIPHHYESVTLWQRYSEQFAQLTEAEAAQLASKFQFSCGQIKQTLEQAKQKLLWNTMTQHSEDEATKVKTIIESAYMTIHHDLAKKSIKLESSWEWQDLILPDDTISLLQQACDRVENRQKVMDDWGFSRLLPYGRGISMLFTGPPGTGKSMSASVMAKQMKSELYRVDLSSVVSKYIGETEKNLAEIFNEAKLSSAILFFDEADALFGKRSEVKDSHDKYANMETSFLLQKMEEYEGLTILATNFAQNLDDAFNRRIQYIVKFPFPDAEQRERLWRSVIPPQLPIDDIDFPFLAKTFELTGGPIKNIVISAAYLAANRLEKVSMQHMVEAAIQEYKKSGKLLMKDKLGQYSQYWKG